MNANGRKYSSGGTAPRAARIALSLVLAPLALGLQRCGGGTPTSTIPPTPVTVTQTALPADTHPAAIVRGPDNNLWYTDTTDNLIGRRAADGTITQFPLPDVGSGPAGMAIGPDGKLWFTEMDGARIGTITTDGVISEFPLATGRQPTGITLGSDGVIWFTEEASDGDRVGRITPGGVITELMTPTAAAMPAGFVTAPDGSMFFAESTANTIGRVSFTAPAAASETAASSTTSTAMASAAAIGAATGAFITEYPIPTADAGAAAVAIGSDGKVWFTERSVDKVGRLDPATGKITEFALPTKNAGAAEIVAGPDCNLWLTEDNAAQIARVTTAGAITEFKPNVGSDPSGITVGSDGNLWYTEHDSGMLAELPVTDQSCANDNRPPVAISHDVTVNTDAGLCTAATASVDNGSYDPDGNLATISQSPAGPYSLGATPVTLTLTDSLGLTSASDAEVTVVDNQPPTVKCPGPLTAECTSPAGATVTFSASASDNCPGTPAAAVCAPVSGSPFPLGTSTVNCTATDAAGNVGSCGLSVTVKDTVAPVITSATADPAVLWPPNHRQVPVTVAVAVSDTCDPAPRCTITGVTANEPIGAEDWQITGPLSVNLEAERAGAGTGRVYQVAVQCTDASGNDSTATAAVTVPHDMGKQTEAQAGSTWWRRWLFFF